jgi:hypothetical protein
VLFLPYVFIGLNLSGIVLGYAVLKVSKYATKSQKKLAVIGLITNAISLIIELLILVPVYIN